MKRFLFPALALGAALSFTACQSDELLVGGQGGNGEDDGRAAYITATISLPSSGSRSATDDGKGEDPDNTNSNGSSNTGNPDTDKETPDVVGPDYEVGRDYENDVRSILLVITDKADQYLTHIAVNGLTENPTMNGTSHGAEYTITTRIKYGVLQKAYAEGGICAKMAETEPMRLYAYANYTNDMLQQFNQYQDEIEEEKAGEIETPNAKLQAWRDFKGTVEEKASMAGQTPQSTNSIWSKRSFLMANASIYSCDFPESLDAWDNYADDRNPLDLTEENGPIDVERVAARLDFRDGSPAETEANTYPIYVSRNYFQDAAAVDLEPVSEESDPAIYNVRLTRMILVNMSKDFYYLRRVQASTGKPDYTPTGDVKYAGKETNTNWVVDTDWDLKKDTKENSTGGITPANAGTYFNFPLFSNVKDTNGRYQYNNVGDTYGWYISSISGNGDDAVLSGEKDDWTSNLGHQQYHTWRYITENTLPSIDAQQTVQSTGIIFKGSIEIGANIEELITDGFISESVRDALLSVQTHRATGATNYPTYKHYELLEGQDNKAVTAASYKEAADQSAYEGLNIPAIYSFQNVLYGGVDDIVCKAKADGEGGAIYTAVDNILGSWYCKKGEKKFEYYGRYATDEAHKTVPTKEDVANGNYIKLNVIIAEEISTKTAPTDDSEDYSTYTVDYGMTDRNTTDNLSGFNRYFIEMCPSQNITVFIPTTEKENNDSEGWGYYCYYFYWLRHNDNGYSGKMGPMEFGSVRNNVYKLAVTKINQIGHPRDTTRDPDPIDPNDPDEEPERSIKVEVNVLPWVVRVNNIEF